MPRARGVIGRAARRALNIFARTPVAALLLTLGMPSSPMRVSRKGGKAPLVIGSPIARNGRNRFLYAVGLARGERTGESRASGRGPGGPRRHGASHSLGEGAICFPQDGATGRP